MTNRPQNADTCDCEPTLTDQQVIDFCRNGYLVLEGVVPDEINRKVVDYLNENEDAASNRCSPIMAHEWFMAGVIKNPAAAGAVRSLLGEDFALPVYMVNHRGKLPCRRDEWHRDGGSIYTHKLEYVQVFYYPQDCPIELGPTQVLPGSHFMRTKANMMANFGTIIGAVPLTAPAGTIFITVYSIWHIRLAATAAATRDTQFRHLLKYNYWRTTVPKQRDWKTDPEFDFSAVDFHPLTGHLYLEQCQGAIAAARMFCWLAGLDDEYQKNGGTSWPLSEVGVPPGLCKSVTTSLSITGVK